MASDLPDSSAGLRAAAAGGRDDGSRAAGEYDAMGAVYATHAEAGPFNADYDRPTILQLAGDVRDRDVLDVGCAAGALAETLVARGARVTGLDASEQMLRLAGRRLAGRATLVRADIGAPIDMLPGASFDVVVASLVLHYLRDWTVPLREFHRLLRPGGSFVMSAHHPGASFQASPSGSYFETELLGDRWARGGQAFSVHSYRRPLREIFAAILGAGMVIEAVQEPEPPSQWRTTHPELWERLMSGPWFLFIRATKPAISESG